MDTPLTIWLVTDRKPGHLNQLLALASRLADRAPVTTEEIAITGVAPDPRRWRRLPDPDLILCAGSRTHLTAVGARAARGGRLVVCMNPTLPTRLFDLCLIPRHGRCPERPNVVTTVGALVNVRPSRDHDTSRGVILIGGPSKHHSIDETSLVGAVGRIVESSTTIAWDLSTSRRTPAALLSALNNLSAPNVTITPADRTPAGWVADRLARAGVAWITEDSVSMICEAVTTGCAVGVLPMPRVGRAGRPSRVVRFIEDFIANNLVTPFDEWAAGAPLAQPVETIDEAGRCASIILERFFPARVNRR